MCLVRITQPRMPALNAHKCQAKEQQVRGGGQFGKCTRIASTISDSTSEYSAPKPNVSNSDSESTPSYISSDEEDAAESLEKFYKVFQDHKTQENLGERIQQVSICLCVNNCWVKSGLAGQV